MPEFISTLTEFFTEHPLWLIGASVLSFAAGLILVPIFVTRIPADYFIHPRRERMQPNSDNPLVRIVFLIVKNVFGVFLVIMGLIMLLTPGQGVLTLLAGLVLMDYPGKYALERWLVTRARVLRAMNWLRRRHGKPPLRSPHARDAE